MEKPIALRNKRGKQLVGILHLPKGNKKWPLVIVCHGFAGIKTGSGGKYVKLARKLENKKIACFRFDFEGCGDSEGDLEGVTVKRCLSDLESVMKWILIQRNINKDKIAFLGSSFGAIIATLFLIKAKFPIKTLIFWNPALNQQELLPTWYTKKDLKEWKKQGYIVRKENKISTKYLKENEKKDYSLILSNISTPILIIHGKKDEVVPVRFSKKLSTKYKNIQLKIYSGADHKFEDYYIQKRLVKDTVNWFLKFLK